MRPTSRGLLVLAVGIPFVTQGGLGQGTGGYRVESFTTDHGLPSQAISSIAETSDGFLWIAAGGFLSRFDGYEFRTYTQANTPALVRRLVHLHAGVGDTLWILDEGNAVLALAGGNATEIVRSSDRFLSAIAQDGSGTLFGIGSGTVWRLGRRSEPDKEILPRIKIGFPDRARLTRDRDGHVWIVDSLHAVRRLDAPGSAASSTLIFNPLLDSGTGAMLTVRARGAMRDVLRPNGDVAAFYLSTGMFPVMVMDREERLWVAGDKNYDVYVRGRPLPVWHIPQLEAGTVGMMLEGGTGCIWMTEIALLKACRVPFRTIPLDLDARKFVTRGPLGSALSWDDAGRVVMITPDDQSQPLAPGSAELRYARVYVDRRGTAWWSPAVGVSPTAGGGAARLLPHPGAYSFAADPNDGNSVWYAVERNLYRAILPAHGRARVADSIPGVGLVSAMTQARDGTLWITAKRPDQRSQLLRIANGKVSTYAGGDGFPVAELRAVLADDDGTVWLGTYGGGLVRFRDGRFLALTEASGLGDNVVTSVLDDDAGNIWMGGNRGVHRVSRRQVTAFLDSGASRVNGVLYGRADGLTSPETSGYPGVRDDSGRFWFPTIAGAAVVDPAHAIALDRLPPRVHVLGMTTERDTVDGEAASVRLTRGARRVTFRYTGISNRNSAGVRYEYRLDGANGDWVDAGHAREATFISVTPGTHIFHVRAINAGGIASDGEATLRFMVPPYFRETPVFTVLLLMSLGVFGMAAVRYRERHLRRREMLLTTAVEERTEKLATALETVAAQANQLRTLDEAKSRFFANVSHEFRTPLSLIIGPVDDLRDGRFGELSTTVRRRLDDVQVNARRLLQLVEQLLDIARLQSGTLNRSAEVRDLVPLLRRLADSFASLAERKGIAFRLSCPVGGVRVRYDPDQMEKVVSNLVGNALKFTPAGGKVELHAMSEPDGDGMAVIEVRDSGPGIAPEFHDRVFERFFQVDDSSRRTHEGTGIGLALVRELVELHGGTIEVSSVLGEGSTFTVRLPLADGLAGNSSEQAVEVSDRAVEVSNVVEALVPPRVLSDSDATTVLVVEDNADLLEFLREHLVERYRVLVAENGVRGLQMAREHVPDLIVSDVMMPQMDGQALCEAVKGDREIDFIPVILLTAKASRDSRMAGLVGGADDYLTKPVDLAELLIRAENLIASRRRVRERYEALNQQLPSVHVPLKSAPRDASSRALLQRLSMVMREHLADEDFGVEAMAVAMGMGRSTLYRRLEPLLGKPPMDAMWDYRLDQAAQWLAETTITVSEVAYGVGFKSLPHFCGRFRDHYGETPSAYRRGAVARAGG